MCIIRTAYNVGNRLEETIWHISVLKFAHYIAVKTCAMKLTESIALSHVPITFITLSGMPIQPILKPKKKKNSLVPLWKKVSKAMQDYFREQTLPCVGGSQNCTGRAEVMHHVFHWGNYKALRLNADNLIPLCHHCHYSVHQDYMDVAIKIDAFQTQRLGVNWQVYLASEALNSSRMTKAEEKDYLLDQLNRFTS